VFFDNSALLEAFLMAPGNHGYTDRVVKIEGVMNAELPQTIFAVLIGAAQWAQHWENLAKRANCILEFVPSNGFNSNSLRIVASTRNGVGLSAGAPILLNYGRDFDPSFSSGRGADKDFKGSLDNLFESQRGRLPMEADQNMEAAAKEEIAQDQSAAVEAANQATLEVAQKAALELAATESQALLAAAEAVAVAAAASAEVEEEKRKQDNKALNPATVDLPPTKRQKVVEGATDNNDIDVCTVSVVPCTLKLRPRDGGIADKTVVVIGEGVPMQLVLVSKSETNKKVVRDHRSGGIGTVLGLSSRFVLSLILVFTCWRYLLVLVGGLVGWLGG
jgi:hypothetical protein